MKDRMKVMHKIQKPTSTIVHAGTEAWDGIHPICNTSGTGYVEAEASGEVTCKRCLKKLQRAEYLGLHLKVVENEDGSSKVVDTREEDAPVRGANPGRCLQRLAKVGKTPTQCVKAHAHEDDHEDRYGQTFPNHAIVPGADPLSSTAQALADASKARDEAAREYSEAKTPSERAEAEDRYETAVALRWEAVNAHRKAREAAGDFGARAQREARAELARLNAPKGTSPLAKRLADDHGLNFF